MCGRATLTKDDFEDIARDLDAEFSPDDARLYRPRYNIAPSDLHWVVESAGDRRVLVPAHWGYLASGRPLINVRGEQVGSGRGFRDAFQARRCVVVTDGFYEWDREKFPYWFHRENGGLVLLAGLFQPPTSGAAAGPPRPRFTILTTQPNRAVAAVHSRMPVVIAPAAIDQWLTAEPARAAELLRPAPDDALAVRRVGKRVGSVKNDDPACLEPADSPGRSAPVQGRLF